MYAKGRIVRIKVLNNGRCRVKVFIILAMTDVAIPNTVVAV